MNFAWQMDEAPGWFDEAYFAAQKAQQMNVIGWRDEQGNVRHDWTAADWPKELARFNADHGTDFNAWDNFTACNMGGYGQDIAMSAVNVSATPLFDVPIYLTNLATRYNNTGYAAPGHAAGQWTAQTAMQHLFQDLHMSAWEHYRDMGMQMMINPSNGFDTAYYLVSRAIAMGDGVDVAGAVRAILAEGLNPIEDLASFGASHGIEARPVRVPVTPGMSAGSQWIYTPDIPDQPDTPVQPDLPDQPGGSTPPGDLTPPPGIIVPPSKPDQPSVPDDPVVDPDVNRVELAAGDTGPYRGAEGRDTVFSAVWTMPEGGNTLDVNDVIQGGANAANTLEVKLGKDWDGFAGQADGAANVTGVQRVVLNHDQAQAAEELVFNAANISGEAVQYDLNASGVGGISLTGLSSAVKTVNYKGLLGTAELSFAGAAPEALTIGIENAGYVPENGQTIAPGLKFAGIRDVTIESLEGQASGRQYNNISLGWAAGIEKLSAVGSRGIIIEGLNCEKLGCIDASQMTGDFQAGVYGFHDGIEAIGESSFLNQLHFREHVEIADAPWKGLWLSFSSGGNVNLAKAQNIPDITVHGQDEVNLTNMTGETVTVRQGVGMPDAGGKPSGMTATITGNIQNLNYESVRYAEGTDFAANGICYKPALESDAKGDFSITMNEKDTLADGSVFRIGEINGTVKIASPNAAPRPAADAQGITLAAGKATALEAEWAGSLYFSQDSDFSSLGQMNVQLKAAEEGGTDHVFTIDETLKMRELTRAEIDAGGGKIDMQGILGGEGQGKLEISIDNASAVDLGSIQSVNGVQLEMKDAGVVDFGSIRGIYMDYNLDSGAIIGDIGVNVTGGSVGVASESVIQGDNLDINFSGVKNGVGSAGSADAAGHAMELQAAGKLNYTGSEGADHITISQLGSGTESLVSTGTGNDIVKIGAGQQPVVSGSKATLNIDLGDGGDHLYVNNDLAANLMINVKSSNFADDAIHCDESSLQGLEQVNKALEAIGSGIRLADGTSVDKGVFTLGGNAYWIDGDASADGAVMNVTLVCAAGASESIFQGIGA